MVFSRSRAPTSDRKPSMNTARIRTSIPSWQIWGGTRSMGYGLYDALRHRVNRRLVAMLAEHLPVDGAGVPYQKDAVRVLEAGSGPAMASSMFARRPGVGLSVCMDLDFEALRIARSRDPGLPAVVGDLLAMPFADRSFALVFNSSTLEHLEDRGLALAEMARVCRADGRVFVGVPYARGPLGFQALIRETAVGRWVGDVYTAGSLRSALERAGLQPILALSYFCKFFIGMVAAKRSAPSPPART